MKPVEAPNLLSMEELKSVDQDQRVIPIPVGGWTKLFNENQLTANIVRSYWAHVVPGIYSPKRNCNCLNITFDENSARIHLFHPLEEFITQSVTPKEVFEKLKQTDNKPTLCGKTFRNGEPVYSCRDCGLDASCVLCVDCFKRSAHRNHKYKIAMSTGAGYCDCGDPEAWRSNIFCDLHIKGSAITGESEDPRKRLPEDLAARAEFIIRTVVHYCYEMLEWDQATSLPESLKVKNSPEYDPRAEDYVTVLFNDEIHTYEQVIQTLTRAIECSTKEAIDFATTIDHEGRSIVKCSIFQTCSQIKQMIEKITGRQGTKPLRCDVMLTSVVAHQTFSMRLLSWLQQILSYCEGFRIIFSSIMKEPLPSGPSCAGPLLEAVMKADVRLWKTARNQWHQLFIIGLLMNAESKKTFAKIFTRIYKTLLKDFINDDHEHSVSIASLAIQIFTAPTLAYTLIAEDDAFNIILFTFLDECKKHRNSTGKLAFERNHATINIFKRVQFILGDLRYLLSVKPNTWTEELRKSFIYGFKKLIELLSWMQGMDSVVRQIGSHVEFEAEWETGINLQLKLAPVLSLVIEWCGSDRIVLAKALKYALNELDDKIGPLAFEEERLCGHRTRCIQYDVSFSSVTVHLPLSRLVAGLLLHMTMQEDDPSSKELMRTSVNTPPESLMELPLRTLVLVAQFRAGMWRRNGYSLVNQIYFYHNVRLRDEMYDRDIMMMQYAAASINPDLFLVQVLHKFGLMYWAKEDFDSKNRKPEDDHVRQTVTLVEEFLNLLLIIVSERFTPGIGQINFDDRMKREIIHWLCTDSMTHSDLLKCLPREISDEVIIEKLILEVADFKRPSPDQPGGKYELKEEFYPQFNPFFYHYTRQEQSTAEEVQLKRKRNNREKLICCPPPIPPDFTLYFSSILKIFQSDVFLHIIDSVLKRACNFNSLSFSETQFEKALHLIGVALHEEIKILEGTSTSPPSFNFVFYQTAADYGILGNLEACLDSNRIGSHRDLLTWTLKKASEVAKLRGGVPGPSSIMSSAENFEEDKPSVRGNYKAELIAQRKARIMAQMRDMQRNFIRDNAEYFELSSRESIDFGVRGSGSMMDLTGTTDDAKDIPAQPCAVGRNQRGKEIVNESHICILCREEQATEVFGRCMVLSAFVQGSTVLSKNRSRKLYETDTLTDTLLMPADLYFGCHVSTCGHVMHSECWQKFFQAVSTKERRRPLRYGRHISFDVDKNEFLCPLCECLSNAVIPLIPPSLYRELDPEPYTREVSFTDWINNLFEIAGKFPRKKENLNFTPIDNSCAHLVLIWSNLNPQCISQYTIAHQELTKKLSDGVKEMMKILTKSINDIYLHPRSEDDFRSPLYAYWATAFTIHSIERVLRDEGKSIFGDLSSRRYNCLQALVRYVGVLALVCESHLSNPSCLDVDAFGLLLTLTLTSSTLSRFVEGENISSIPMPAIPNGSMSDQHLISLILLFHSVQIILTNENLANLDSDSMEVDGPVDSEDESELLFVHDFYNLIMTEASGKKVNEHADDSNNHEETVPFNKLQAQQLLKALKVKLLPFLRSTALFFHLLTGVVPPGRLKEGGSQSLPCSEIEYSILCEYLGLSCKLSSLVESQLVWSLIKSWCRHPEIKSKLTSSISISDSSSLSQQKPQDKAQKKCSPLPLIEQPHTVNQLINLPKDYSELINGVSQFPCPNNEGDDSRTPTMCLVCGTVLCSQSYCCQIESDTGMVGACTHHAHNCGAGVGIFLRIRDCKILLLAGRFKGCYMPSPYIDEYGETDQGLFRGNPLTLCESSYKELHRLWLRHGIPEQVAHALELHSNMASINWNLL